MALKDELVRESHQKSIIENRRCRTGKHNGPEGRTSPRISPKKVPNIASETLETEQKIGAAGRGNTMALKDELVRESHQKSA